MFNLTKMLIIFIYLTSICCFFISSQNVSSQITPPQDTTSPQDISYIYEEPIEGLKRYSTYAISEGTLMIWMAFENKEDPLCMLPYFHLRLIERTGRITYIDLNYTFPLEAVCPVNMTFKLLNYNYIMIIYVKSNNGVKGKYGLIINYDSEIMSETYLGSDNDYIMSSIISEKGFIRIEDDKKEIAMWHLYNILDITTGKVVELGSDNNGNYKSGGSFGPEFVHYNIFTRNNTLLGIKEQTGNKLEILLKPLLRLNNQGVEYDNPVIESTKPAVNEVIDSSINFITIKYAIPVRKFYISLLYLEPFKSGKHSESITGLLRLNEEGSSKFLQTNQSEFFNNIIQAFSKIIPVDEQRITTNGKWKNDPTSPKKVLLSFAINEAKNAIEPSSKTIFDNLSTLVEKKGFTALSYNEYTSLIDESASLTITQDYFGKYLPLIIIFLYGIPYYTACSQFLIGYKYFLV
ncbi:hypothetical protein RhiirA5_400909 [Rhizophagus irregularis]|uniref:Uncharacterized protein n=1 Tax=Rhizophagus irregularis TaxID=588596 RepID=A0A2N0PF91_9GLOM|nr:hypothetical protein RhiirA5_400909 [Rhizophagus irregularis]